MKTLCLMALLLLNALVAQAQVAFSLELISDVFSKPVDITNAGDERLFIVEKDGTIRILTVDGQAPSTPFLNIDSKVRSSESERGLLGLAFHPNYQENGYFFVNYTNNQGTTIIARYQVSTDNSDLANPASEKILLTVPQPFSNHNGGDLNFGKDGYLYIGLGDGGSGGDPVNNGQKKSALLGKMLRIDVDNGDPYAIPADNPFIGDSDIPDEIWAFGLRNPWRFSFDRLTGDMWIGDVGQGDREEINFQAADSKGGENYGWRCYEGNLVFNGSNCAGVNNYQFPVFDYESNLPTGCSINGGYVYRGDAFPLLYGSYIYSDYCSGRIWMLRQNEAGNWINNEVHNGPNSRYVAMGEDSRGELYLAHIDGDIFRIRDQTTSTIDNLLPAQLSASPNPFDQNILIEGSLPESGEYRQQLFNAQGQVVWEESSYEGGDFNRNINTKDLPGGIYLFSIERNGKKKVMKLMKQ